MSEKLEDKNLYEEGVLVVSAKGIPDKSESKAEKEKKSNPKPKLHANHRKRMYKKAEWDFEFLEPHEQLETILFAILPRVNTNEIAHRLLDKFGSLHGVFSASTKELMEVPGIGTKTAHFFSMMYDVFGAVLRSRENRPKLRTVEEMREYISSFFWGKNIEYAYMFTLNNNFNLIDFHKLSEGDNDETYIYAQTVMKKAVSDGAKYVIIAHNHPSGVLEPSKADIDVTKKVEKVLGDIDVCLWDSLIFTEIDVCSMRAQNYLTTLQWNCK